MASRVRASEMSKPPVKVSVARAKKVPGSFLAVLNIVKKKPYGMKPSDYPEVPAYRE